MRTIILEIELINSAPTFGCHKDSGEIVIENKKYAYLVLNFIAGNVTDSKNNS
jgi:hypothetical protein